MEYISISCLVQTKIRTPLMNPWSAIHSLLYHPEYAKLAQTNGWTRPWDLTWAILRSAQNKPVAIGGLKRRRNVKWMTKWLMIYTSGPWNRAYFSLAASDYPIKKLCGRSNSSMWTHRACLEEKPVKHDKWWMKRSWPPPQISVNWWWKEDNLIGISSFSSQKNPNLCELYV